MSTSTLDTTTAAATSSSGGSSMNILSDKVQRALQVRTDTPAMKAALEALGQLDNGSINSVGKPSHNDNKNTSSSSHHNMMVPLDARSVRHAIEYDALQQALLLQDNLSSLVTTIRELREGISDVATLAHNVQQAISSNVVTETTRTSMISTTSTTTTTAAAAGGTDGSDTMAAADQQQQQQQQYQNQQAEERLAATIAEAFKRRNVARHRLQAITTFLETFDLSEKDSRLLDHYNFEDMHSTTNMQMHSQHQHPNSSSDSAAAAAAAAPNGMAFLRALERVWQIRRALVKTFGSGLGGMGGNNNAFMMETSSSFEDGEKSSGGGGLGAGSALRMMESLAQKQEHAYERLYHWLQSYLQLLGKHSLTLNATEQQQQQQYYDYGLMQLDQSLQHPFVQHALYTLRHVQAFYHHTVELVAGRRRQEETRLFLLALTTGIPQEQQPPLERLAHDPTLYVGEMLAHAFRAMSSEADVALTVIHYKPSSTKKKQQQSAKAATVGSTVGGGDASANGQEGGTEQHGENDDDDEDDDDDDQNDDDLDGSAHSDDFDYGNNMTSFSGTTSSLTDKTMTAAQMLSVTMSGMSRPLHARVQQVIDSLARRPNHRNHNRTQDGSDPSALVLEQVDSDDNMMMLGDDDDIMFDDEGAIVRNKLTHLYEICGLLLFYISAMSKTVGKLQEADINRIKRRLLKKRAKMALLAKDENEEGKNNDNDDDVLETPSAIMDPEANALIVCLIQSLEEAAKAFEASIRVYCAMLNQLSATTGESQPNLVLAMMVRIAECRMSSPGFAQDVIGSTNQACQTILSIEWVTETLVQAALACCSNLDGTYAVKQALATAKKADIDVIVAEKLDEQIEAMEASLTNKLVETESIKVLDLCGLGSIVAAWNRWKERSATSSVLAASTGRDEDDDNTTAATLMASYPGLSAENVEAGMKDFLASLYSPPLPSLESAVKDPLFRKRARVKIAETVCQTYAALYADITSVSKGGYEDVSFLGHSPDQVKRLFTA